jgi:hypothetical protein
VTIHESNSYPYFSSALHIPSTVLPNHSISMMIIDAEYSSKREWVNKSKQILLVINSKGMSSELTVDLIKMVSQ